MRQRSVKFRMRSADHASMSATAWKETRILICFAFAMLVLASVMVALTGGLS
jgi:hypothetical protein